MNKLSAAYKNELYKLYKKKKVYVAAVLCLLTVAVGAVMSYLINNFMGISVTTGASFPVVVLPIMMNTLISLFIIFICVDMFGGEFAANTIKFTLTTPASRFKIFTAKFLAAATFIAASLAAILLLSLIASFILGGDMSGLLYAVIAYIVSVLPLTVFALLVILIANLTRGTTSAFMLSILAFLVFRGVEFAAPTYSAMLFTASYDWYTYFAAAGDYINYGKIFRLLLIQGGYFVMLFSLGYMLFEKREI